MKQEQVRASFLDFFKSKKHTVVRSAPVVPQGDPTLLFTNAGMNQFKDIFLGLGKAKSRRVCDTQKCLRVSGKHNDLEEVGVDTYHHTFFEMLGNWSFGDYYKKEAIAWAWELLTGVWKLDQSRLYATVFREDDEANSLWQEHSSLPVKRILRFDEKDNFWEMGETGPCGPCSEIHYDQGPGACDKENVKGHQCRVNGDCSRYIEIWNLVFIQYNREPGGKLTDLKEKHIDTGMGFERICAVLQGKNSNYDSDVFTPLIAEISRQSGKKYSGAAEMTAMRVIADHIRSISFSIADGVTPSNEGRGYVIRRILRRAFRYGRTLGFQGPFLCQLVPVLAGQFKEVFPELEKQKDFIAQTIRYEEEAFHKTLDNGLVLFNELLETLKKSGAKKEIPGDKAFLLYDTYGFPADLTALLAREAGYTIDQEGFDREMEAQKKRSRRGESLDMFNLEKILGGIGEKTVYQGEERLSVESSLTAIIKDDKQIEKLPAGNAEVLLVFNETVFYGEGGGQVGDRGVISSGDTVFKVHDTLKHGGFYLHKGTVEKGELRCNGKYLLVYDREYRQAVRRHHSATHLLQRALAEVLGEHIKQSGSLVSAEKLRFDFNHFKAMTPEELDRTEHLVNMVILANHPVMIKEMTKEESEKQGAKQFFDEKYGDKVRVVNMGDWSLELCGGSHVRTTGEIGSFRILGESSSASGIRRVEAVTGMAAYDLCKQEREILSGLCASLEVNSAPELPAAAVKLAQSHKAFKKQAEKNQSASLQDAVRGLEGKKFPGGRFIYHEFKETDPKLLRAQIDNLKNENKKTVIFFTVKNGPKVLFLCGVTPDLTGTVKAGDLVKIAAEVCGGGGGGRPDFAQAGGKDPGKAAGMEKRILGAISS